jgi:small subunit ribosomal protein S10
LRDPFVKKEHQEQFERRTHKRLIVVESNEELLNELKKISIPSGVAVAIK